MLAYIAESPVGGCAKKLIGRCVLQLVRAVRAVSQAIDNQSFLDVPGGSR